MLQTVTLADGSELAVPGTVPKLSCTPGRHRRHAPVLGQDTEAAGAGALAAAGAACMVAAFGAAVAVGAAAVCANDNAATVDSRAATIRCLFKVVSNGGRETRFAVAPTLLSRPGFRSACGYNAGFTRVIDSAGKETWPAVFPGSAVRVQAGPAAPAQSPTHVHCATRP